MKTLHERFVELLDAVLYPLTIGSNQRDLLVDDLATALEDEVKSWLKDWMKKWRN